MRKREPPPSNQPRTTLAKSWNSPVATMADKQAKSTASKPITPHLSSNFRNVKNPLTPRLVGSAPSTPALASRTHPLPVARSPGKDGQVTTPLNGNITPRSGARSSRIGTESPATPSATKPVKNTGSRSRASSGNGGTPGLGITSPRLNASTSALPMTNQASATTARRRLSAAKSMVEAGKEREAAPKFFHADVVKSPIPSPDADKPGSATTFRSPFFVASPSLPASNLPTQTPDPDEKFFRANDIPQPAQLKRNPQPHIPLDKLSNPSNAPIDQLQAATQRASHSTPPQSPKKAQSMFFPKPNSPPKVSPPKPPSPQLARARIEWPRASPPAPTSWTAQQLGHRKSLSASSISTSLRRLSNPQAQAQLPSDLRPVPTTSPSIPATHFLSPESLSPRSTSLASTNTIPTSVTSLTSEPSSDISKQALPPPAIPGPNESSIEALPQANPHLDLAAQARRERKVLDLEISNSSLLAINKTLERELRKQNAELRRFRRLSRSGRLSMAPANRVASGQSVNSLGTLTELDGEDVELSEDSELDEEDVDDELDSLPSNDSSRSRQRARDEKRLMLDLSKHQQLLIDSQNLSQSIKRCLTCTEELIRDGNRALEYRVGIGDIKLGGRVLNAEEIDELGFDADREESVARQGLLSPSIARAEANPWANPAESTRTEAVLSPSLASSAVSEVQAWLGTEPLSIQSLNELSEMLDLPRTPL